MTTKCLIYCRTSGDDSERDSLSSQADECLKYAKGKNYQVIDVLKESPHGQSGADLYSPQLQHAIQLAEQGKYNVLLTRDTTRFTRDRAKGVIVEFMLSQSGVQLEFVWNNFDGEHGDLLRTLAYWASEQERLAAVRRMKAGREKALANGSLITHGKPPFGYRSEKIDGLYQAFVIEDEAATIRLIFKLYTEDKLSANAIARKLNKEKYPTSQGGKWHPWTVLWILGNESYIGRYHYGKVDVTRKNILSDNGKIITKKTVKMHNEDHHIIIEIPPIIDDKTWRLARIRLDRNKNDNVGRPAKYQYLLRKRCKCGNCDFATHCNTKNNGRYRYYECGAWRCNHDEISKDCIKSVSAKDVDNAVWQWLENLLQNRDKLRDKIGALRDEYQSKTEPLEATANNIESLLETAKKKYQRLLDLMLESDNFSLLKDKKQMLESEIAELESGLERTMNELMAVEADFIYLDQIFEKNPDAILSHPLMTMPDEAISFEKRREYIENFNVTAAIVRKPDGIYLDVSSDIGGLLQKISDTPFTILQLPHVWIISDRLQLA